MAHSDGIIPVAIGTIQDLKKRIAALEAELAEAREQVGMIRDYNEALRTERQQLQQQLAEARRDRDNFAEMLLKIDNLARGGAK